MRRLLGALLLVLALSACGSDTGDTETDSPEQSAKAIEIVSETAAGGQTGGPAVRVDRPAGLATLTLGFRSPGLAAKIRAAVQRTRMPDGQALYGAVIAVECDVPPSASVEVTDGKVLITAGKVAKPLSECLAAVTSVAIVLVDTPLT